MIKGSKRAFWKRLDQGSPWASWEEAAGDVPSRNRRVPSLSQALV